MSGERYQMAIQTHKSKTKLRVVSLAIIPHLLFYTYVKKRDKQQDTKITQKTQD